MVRPVCVARSLSVIVLRASDAASPLPGLARMPLVGQEPGTRGRHALPGRASQRSGGPPGEGSNAGRSTWRMSPRRSRCRPLGSAAPLHSGNADVSRLTSAVFQNRCQSVVHPFTVACGHSVAGWVAGRPQVESAPPGYGPSSPPDAPGRSAGDPSAWLSYRSGA